MLHIIPGVHDIGEQTVFFELANALPHAIENAFFLIQLAEHHPEDPEPHDHKQCCHNIIFQPLVPDLPECIRISAPVFCQTGIVQRLVIVALLIICTTHCLVGIVKHTVHLQDFRQRFPALCILTL